MALLSWVLVKQQLWFITENDSLQGSLWLWPSTTFIRVNYAQPKVYVIDQVFKDRQIMAKVLKENLAKAQNRMKMNAYKKRT